MIMSEFIIRYLGSFICTQSPNSSHPQGNYHLTISGLMQDGIKNREPQKYLGYQKLFL